MALMGKPHHASVAVQLPGSISLDGRDEVLTKVQEYAFGVIDSNGRRLVVQWSAPTQWLLRGLVEQTISEVEAMGYDVEFPERDLDDTTPYSLWVGEAESFA